MPTVVAMEFAGMDSTATKRPRKATKPDTPETWTCPHCGHEQPREDAEDCEKCHEPIAAKSKPKGRLEIARQVLGELRIDKETLSPEDLLAQIDAWKNLGKTPSDVSTGATTDAEHLGAAAYRRFEKAMAGEPKGLPKDESRAIKSYDLRPSQSYDLKPAIEQWRTYQAAFDYFNERLFEGQLPSCILNLSRCDRRVRGYFSANRWKRLAGETTHEISLSPTILATDEPIRSLSTLVHEMVHLWQQCFGKPPKNCYHNKEWASKMDAVGLVPSTTGKPGGKRTGMSCSHYVEPGGVYEVAFSEAPPEVVLPWSPRVVATPKAGGGKASKVVYQCPSCAIKAWGKPGLSLRCEACDKAMAMEARKETPSND